MGHTKVRCKVPLVEDQNDDNAGFGADTGEDQGGYSGDTGYGDFSNTNDFGSGIVVASGNNWGAGGGASSGTW